MASTAFPRKSRVERRLERRHRPCSGAAMHFRALGAALVAGAFFLGCGGATDENGGSSAALECASSLGPEVTTVGVIRLDTLDLGEDRRWQTIGSNLDGRCTSFAAPRSGTCLPPSGASATAANDGTSGIDNAFGKHIVPMMQALFGRDVSTKVAGHSFIAFEGDGRATFYIGEPDKVRIVIPLVKARLSTPNERGLSTLTAIIPRERFVASLLAHANLLAGPIECASTTMLGVAEMIRQTADIPLSGEPEPTEECSGISFAMELSGTSALAPPSLPPDCGAGLSGADPVLPGDVGIVESDR
jgi:hypothetical protein